MALKTNRYRVSCNPFPSPTMKGNNDFENQPLSDFLQAVPSPRGRGLGRGQNLKIRRIVFLPASDLRCNPRQMLKPQSICRLTTLPAV